MARKTIPAAGSASILAKGAVHVWRIPLAIDPAQADQSTRWLTAAERSRAGRFIRDDDRLRFQLGRAATRCLLARYLDMAPEQVGIDVDQAGKPRLAAATAGNDRMIHFNLSHSGSWIVAAFARSFPVGIDVESPGTRSTSAELIRHVMSDTERRVLKTLPEDRQAAAFLKCWTSKEAFVKGCGVGLSVALQAIEVCIDPELPAQLITAPLQLRPGDWLLHTLSFSDRHAATLAVAAQSAAIVETSLDSWRDIAPGTH